MNKRIEEIKNGMSSFAKELYNKGEMLPELLSLQSEMVNLTFNGNHAENANLRIWDVEAHLDSLNEECGHIADAEIERFKAGCKIVCNTIKAEMSGQAGEYKACRSLETLRCNNVILRNVEFKLDNHRTELDMVVITEKAVFIIEVKNPAKDIYIDERGNYCRVTHDTLVFDKNIGEKMNDKEYLLREALKSTDIENINIVSLVVFTNSSMQVENRFPYITTCYLSDLPHRIGGYVGDRIYSDETVDKMVATIEENKCHEEYPMPINMQEFKHEFATVMAILENAKEAISKKETEEISNESLEKEKEAELNNTMPNATCVIKKYRKFIPLVASFGIVALGAFAGVLVSTHKK